MYETREEINAHIKKTLAEACERAHKRAAEAEQSKVPAAAEAEQSKDPAPELVAQETPSQNDTIPYAIIGVLTKLDNIYETRLFGWVLAKAQSVLKLYNKDLSAINLQHALDVTRVTLPAHYCLNQGDKNYKQITQAFNLANKRIDYEANGRKYFLNIIAFPELYKGDDGRLMLTFLLHKEVWHALLDFSKGYRKFSLSTYIQLTTKYSVIMYLLCSRQTVATNYSTMRLRQILGCDQKHSYDRGANFVAKVLDPAREELLAKAPYYFDYSCTKTGRAHGITEIIITPKVNDKILQKIPSGQQLMIDQLRLRIDDDVRRYCVDKFALTPKALDRLEPILLKAGDKAMQLQVLSQINDNCVKRHVRNRAGYATRSLQNLIK